MGLSINNVSMDYFLRGVDAAKPKNAPPAAAPAQANENKPVVTTAANAGELVSQLDVLLVKAAKASTKGVDGKTIKEAFQKLVDDGVLSEASLELLEQAAGKATTTLKALNKFTGQQLATAFSKKGNLDASSKVGKVIKAAVDAQQELANLLAQFGKQLDSLERHKDDPRVLANIPQFKGVDDDVRNKVEDMRAICDRRATEIVNLAFQMKDFATHRAAHRQNADPNIVAILETKVNELLPRQALAMHGTADALAAVDKSLIPLANKIEAFRKNPSNAIDPQEFAELQSEVNTMQAAIDEIGEHGVNRDEKGNRMVVSKDIVDALKQGLAKVKGLFETARQDVVGRILDNHIKTVRSLVCVDSEREKIVADASNDYKTMLERRDEMLATMQDYRDAELGFCAASDNAKKKEFVAKMNAAIKTLEGNVASLRQAASRILDGKSPVGGDIKETIARCYYAKPMISAFLSSGKKMVGRGGFFTGAEALAVLEGRISVSSVVEARARGLEDSDVDPANEDANIVSERRLGAGSAGRVYELKRSDGTCVVFKGEAESRTGLAHLASGSGANYDEFQQTVNLNIATKKAAEVLGMGDLIVNYSAGSHKGVFGFYMEKANGLTPRMIEKDLFSPLPEDGLTPDEIKELPADKKKRIKADLMRQLNRLQWLDLVTGQNDRHGSNYFVHVDRATHKVTVKGIDNDACYSQFRIGATTFAFDGISSGKFREQLKKIASKVDKDNADAVYEKLLEDPGISYDKDGNFVVDAAKIKSKVVSYAVVTVRGAVSIALPDKIDNETYETLIALKKDPERKAYLDSILPRLSKNCLNVAISRLNTVIAHADKLKKENKVISKEGWLEAQETPLETDGIPVEQHNGNVVRIVNQVAERVNKAVCPSYFTRDGLDKLFN